MPHLIEVAFKGNRKDFFLWDADELPPMKAAVIVDADRGEDLGFVHALGDAAKRLDGIGRCGRQYCSSSWLPELRPVNLGVAKDQRLSLNPSQISGACGRLMCCLRYEHEFYVESRKRFPKEGKAIKTKRGEEKVLTNDIFRDRITLRGVEGETRVL